MFCDSNQMHRISPSEMNKETRKRRSRAQPRTPESRQEGRRGSKSAWALASSRFDDFCERETETPSGLHTKQRRISRPIQKPTKSSSTSRDTNDGFHISLDIESDSELLLTPPKAKKLIEDICDIVGSAQKSPCESSYGSLMSFDTDSFEDPKPMGTKTSRSTRESENLKLEIDQYLRETFPESNCDDDVEEDDDEDEDEMQEYGNASGNVQLAFEREEMKIKMSQLENGIRERDFRIEQLRKSKRKGTKDKKVRCAHTYFIPSQRYSIE